MKSSGILLYFFSSYSGLIYHEGPPDKFTVAVAASYTGLILWRLFIRLDSLRYPLRTYSDIVDRIYGKRARQVSSLLQNVQLLVVVCRSRRSSAHSSFPVSRSGSTVFQTVKRFLRSQRAKWGYLKTTREYGWATRFRFVSLFVLSSGPWSVWWLGKFVL